MNKQELLEKLQSLLDDTSADILEKLSKEIGSTKKSVYSIKSEHSVPTSYSTFNKTVTCITCGSVTTYQYRLMKNQQITALLENGRVVTHISKGDTSIIDVESYASRCDKCEASIKTWSREKLEAKYISLLHSCHFKEVLKANGSYEEPTIIQTSLNL
ncbi:MAG: hypothetical protein BWY21_02142 [Parcubacteria group bacterium ADurb.Bin216]|nr:MAG: hypothetical protein BWY21_02142 [Parcubacteria group bacterium ADurb.Bin216]